MRELNESYYDILRVAENCNKEDIKKAYIELCKNYHPDKLTSDTPEGAKKFIAARMSIINEAHEVLKNENIRRQYDAEMRYKSSSNNDREEIRYKSSENNRECRSRNSSREHEHCKSNFEDSIENLLEENLLQNALKQLELNELRFYQELKTTISNLESKYSKNLKTIKNHSPGSLQIMDSSMKLEKSLTYGFASFIGLWLVTLGSILSLIGWVILFVFGILFIQNISLPVYKSDYVKAVKAAKSRRDNGLAQFKLSIDERINHFKRIPIYSINYEFIKKLSLRDRLLLVKALQLREDAQKAEESVQSALKVATAIGILALCTGQKRCKGCVGRVS
jgi:curved DNA-binding protein CbpA